MVFDEDYYAYLYRHYDVPEKVWLGEIGCSEETYRYLRYWYGHAGSEPLENALADQEVTVNLKYRLQNYLDRDSVVFCGEEAKLDRSLLTGIALRHFAREERTLAEFCAFFNEKLRESGVPESHPLYVTEENRHNRGLWLSGQRNVLWKNGERLRYYDFDRWDFTELLDALDLHQYQDVELSAEKFVMDDPALMEKYDIRDGYEMHVILKTIVNPVEYPDIVFSRQPMIRFGNADRTRMIVDLIEELSPVSTNDLVSEIRARYGFKEELIRANILGECSSYYHNGFYNTVFRTMPEERQTAFRAVLTEDLYSFEQLRSIYTKLFPDADLREVNPRMLKQMGFIVNSRYVVQHYKSAEEYLTYVLTKDDHVPITQIRRQFSFCYTTLTSVLYRLCASLDLLYYEPEQLMNIRRLNKLGVSKADLQAYIDCAYSLAGEEQFFTVHSLRQNGFVHPLDNLGLSDYFYNALLLTHTGISYNNVFGGLILYKGSRYSKPTRTDFIVSLIKDQTGISLREMDRLAVQKYGFPVGTDKYDLIYIVEQAVQRLGMYFDRTMEKVYRDQTYYFADLEDVETED